jgi:hypothetical protein
MIRLRRVARASPVSTATGIKRRAAAALEAPEESCDGKTKKRKRKKRT